MNINKDKKLLSLTSTVELATSFVFISVHQRLKNIIFNFKAIVRISIEMLLLNVHFSVNFLKALDFIGSSGMLSNFMIEV